MRNVTTNTEMFRMQWKCVPFSNLCQLFWRWVISLHHLVLCKDCRSSDGFSTTNDSKERYLSKLSIRVDCQAVFPMWMTHVSWRDGRNEPGSTFLYARLPKNGATAAAGAGLILNSWNKHQVTCQRGESEVRSINYWYLWQLRGEGPWR